MKRFFLVIFTSLILFICSVSLCFADSYTIYSDVQPSSSTVSNLINGALNYGMVRSDDYIVFTNRVGNSTYTNIIWADKIEYSNGVFSSDRYYGLRYIGSYGSDHSFQLFSGNNLSVTRDNYFVVSNISNVGFSSSIPYEYYNGLNDRLFNCLLCWCSFTILFTLYLHKRGI